MKALMLKEIKQPMALEDITPRVPNSDEVLAEVKAAALNRRDLWIKLGQYPGITLPTILGSDGVVVVDEKEYVINPNIHWGDDPDVPDRGYRILGLEQWGTLAEVITIGRDRLHPKPSHLTVTQSAALPLGGLTAYRAVFNPKKGNLKEGQKVLITGIGGGVALFALQFALTAKAEVFVTSSQRHKIDAAKVMGATDGVNYRDDDWAKQLRKIAGGFDVIIDSGGGASFGLFAHLCNPGARIAFFGATAGHWQKVDAPRLFLKQVTLAGSTMGSDAEFEEMLQLVNDHRIVPTISHEFDLADGNLAMDLMQKGGQFGKIVLRP